MISSMTKPFTPDEIIAAVSIKLAEQRALIVSLEAKLDELMRQPGPQGEKGLPGEPGPQGAPGKDGQDGKSLTIEDLERAVVALPGAKDGKDGKPGNDGVDGKDGGPGPEGAPGKLPIAEQWADKVHYQAEVVIWKGSTYQAIRDTGREPPHDDWICLAAGGKDGSDGRSFAVRGTWTAEEEYQALDVVALGGAAFVARRDAPGACPGDGWQLIASQGKRGNQGDRGLKGDKGERGEPGQTVTVVAASVNDEGLQTLTMSDGSQIDCDFYQLLARRT